MLRLLFWFSIAAILYTYLGYPLLVWLGARCRHRHVHKAAATPRVSVIIACHNEARHIEARLRNLLDCDYPPNQLEIITAEQMIDAYQDPWKDGARPVTPGQFRTSLPLTVLPQVPVR